MSKGTPTPEDVRIEFRAQYLRLRNASAAARAVGIPERTGAKLANDLEKTSEFAEECRAMRARALPAAEAALMVGAELALDEMKEGGRDGAAWYRSLVEAYKAIATARATLTDSGDVRPPEPTIIQYLRPDSVDDADDPVSP